MRTRLTAAVSGLSLILRSVGPVAAQDDAALLRDAPFDRNRNIAVAERPKPEYAPIPITVGAFVLAPAITTETVYDDDIYANNDRRAADGIWRVQPALSLQSDWGRHQVAAFARADAAFYDRHSNEDTADYAVGASGRLDVHHDLGFAAGAGFERDTLPRTSEASPADALRPIRFDLADAFIEATQAFNRLRLTARASLDDYNYDNGHTVTGAPLYQRDQDRTAAVSAFRAEYAYRPNASLFATVTLNARDYRDKLPGEASRTSSGYEADLGSSFDFSRLVRGEAHLGYLEQDYHATSLFKPIHGAVLGGKVDYFLSPITTLTLSADRSVQDSGIVNVGGYLADIATLRIDHELLRNLTLSATISGGEDRYSPYSRINCRLTGTFGAVYLMNRITALKVAYARLAQDSTGAEHGVRFDINRMTLSLALKL